MKRNENKPLIGIIGGHGRMGRLFADFFENRGIDVIVADVDTKLKNRELAAKCDITIVSVPIDKTVKVIKEVVGVIPKTSALVDMTSIKQPAIFAMMKGECEVFGIHPMFGNSNPIPGQTVIMVPTKKSGKWLKWMEQILIENKVKIRTMTAKNHDQMMNVAQGLIHFADITFADALRRTKIPPRELFLYTGKASELKVQLAARLIAQDAGLYGNIQIQNPHRMKSLKLFRDAVNELIKIVEKKDVKKFCKYFERNKKFLGSYADEAFEDSSYLIDKLLEKYGDTEMKTAKAAKGDMALLGPKGTYSEMAARKFGAGGNLYFTKDINEVAELVANKSVAMGILPIENKGSGTIRESLDALFYKNIHISDEVAIPVHHCLFVVGKAKADSIKKIFSHPQALSQCKDYIRKNFPNASLEQFPSTTAAVDRLLKSRDPHVAVIASKNIEDNSELKLIAQNIEDDPENETKFVIIEMGTFKKAKENHNKTAIAFHFKKDSPGTLMTVLQNLADSKINMTRIESRPSKAAFGDYIFYLDFEGTPNDEKVKIALSEITKKVAKLKMLGTY